MHNHAPDHAPGTRQEPGAAHRDAPGAGTGPGPRATSGPFAGKLTTLPDGDRAWVPPDDGVICDFCSSRPVLYCYPAHGFALEAFLWQSVGNWAACEPCGALIEAGDLDGLTRRCLDLLAALIRRERGYVSAGELRAVEPMLRSQHAMFGMNRAGPRHPHHPVAGLGVEGPHAYPDG